MLIVIGTVRLPPTSLEDARAIMSKMVIASRAEEGCLDYNFAEDLLDPGLIRVSEQWSGQSALDRHLRSDHLKSWRSNWAALGIIDRQLTVYSATGGTPT
ncbi:putative quinol monooxygenase [Sphingomonas bacterium]|uniref:putative quinol monooxygenase n=1 Tax=Sphingomonas bacterium TaxID=1895847 RepID=UPI00262001DB|nr:putative quinol monooxygenase [Sphingomonas bacterium]